MSKPINGHVGDFKRRGSEKNCILETIGEYFRLPNHLNDFCPYVTRRGIFPSTKVRLRLF